MDTIRMCRNCVAYKPPHGAEQGGAIEAPPGECRLNPPTLITKQVQRQVPTGMDPDTGDPTFAVQTGTSYESAWPPTPTDGWCRQFKITREAEAATSAKRMPPIEV